MDWERANRRAAGRGAVPVGPTDAQLRHIAELAGELGVTVARPPAREGAVGMSGIEWIAERGDTVTLLRWAVHVPSGHWFLVPAGGPSVMVW